MTSQLCIIIINTILLIVYFKAYKHVMYLTIRMIFPQEQRNTSEICKVNVQIYRDVQNERLRERERERERERS